jgi:purine-nucleoside phosphorylase
MPQLPQQLAATARALGPLPELVVVLGSGFKGFEALVQNARTVELASLPHVPVPAVEGHGASLVIGEAAGRKVAVLTGRVHMYEGFTPDEAVYPLRALQAAGARKVLLTNASGSVDKAVPPGSAVLVKDQINLTGRNCLVGAEARALGPVFVDMVSAFDKPWRDAIKAAAPGETVDGVYVGLLGPTYESPAETAMLGRLGAHVVGMSTVQEVIAARHLGMRVACLSFVSNYAGGLSDAVTHGEVLSTGAAHKKRLHQLLLKAIEVCPA